MSFVEKLNQIVAELSANPEIYVAHYKVLPPNLEAIAQVEEALGYELDPSITDFYKSCGGIQLFWLSKENDEFELKKEYFQSELAKQELFDFQVFIGGAGMLHDGSSWDNLRADGAILIPPIETVFLDADYIGNADECVAKDDLEAYDIFEDVEALKIHKFDMFDVCVNAAFILDGRSNPAILAAYDSYEYAESAIIYFADYLELLLQTKGSVSRGHGFLISGDFEHATISREDIESIG